MAERSAAIASRQAPGLDPELRESLELLERRVHWLATWTIHNANHVRPNLDKMKVGGHQASCASITTLMTALYFHVLRPQDRVAVKPHASPVFHAIQYLLGNQSREQLERFRAFKGAQSYPSRTKDADDVDFSTGSVGLGVAITAFASMVQDYLGARGWLDERGRGRMIALVGDAELDEGNIYEAAIEAYKHNLRNVWWIVDYNRQSLDSVTSDRMYNQFGDIFGSLGFEVVTLKYGKRLRRAFAERGGDALRRWIEDCSNAEYAALTYKGGAAWRERLGRDLGNVPGMRALLDGYDDAELASLMLDLGGHCMETLVEAFDAVTDDRPRLFIAYTTKGYRMPFQGHKDNHPGLMNPTQLDQFRAQMGVPTGEEWEPFAGLEAEEAGRLRAFLAEVPFARERNRRRAAPRLAVPADLPRPTDPRTSTQAAFGKIMSDLARRDDELVARLVTTSPDVTTSTNLGGWVNRRGLFSRQPQEDLFDKYQVVTAQKWNKSPEGQHIELGIAENNLFLLLGAIGLSHSLFGQRLIPVGALYDPFIARGLDALNYACYQDARFLLLSTPSGITLAPEGGAHQSIYTPVIGMGQPGLTYFEPAFVDELVEVVRWSLEHLQADDGGSVYLRLSTRLLEQVPRDATESWRRDVIAGAYWHVPPEPGAELAIVYTGAVAPEAIEAHARLREELPGVGLLAVPSPDRLHADWTRALRVPWTNGERTGSHAERLLAPLSPRAGLVTVIDGSPSTLSWLGGVCGHRVVPLGVERFGQSGKVDDLYREYRLDTEAILDACAGAFLPVGAMPKEDRR